MGTNWGTNLKNKEDLILKAIVVKVVYVMDAMDSWDSLEAIIYPVGLFSPTFVNLTVNQNAKALSTVITLVFYNFSKQ